MKAKAINTKARISHFSVKTRLKNKKTRLKICPTPINRWKRCLFERKAIGRAEKAMARFPNKRVLPISSRLKPRDFK